MGNDAVDTNGRVFIDRDPELFEEIVRILRGYAFKSHPRLTWEEIKLEADFYLVPTEIIDMHAPEPEIGLPPEMISIDTTCFRIEHTKKSCHWIPVTAVPPDVEAKMYTAGVHGRAVNPVFLKEQGFVQIGEGHTLYERKVRIIYYAKTLGGKLLIPSHENEIERKEFPHWTYVAYAMYDA